MDDRNSRRPFKNGHPGALLDVKILQEASVRYVLVDEKTLSAASRATKASQADEIVVPQARQYLQPLEELSLVGLAARLGDALHGAGRPVSQDSLVNGRETAFPEQIRLREALRRTLDFFQVEHEALENLLREAAGGALGHRVPPVRILYAYERRSALPVDLAGSVGADPAARRVEGAPDLLFPPAVPREREQRGPREGHEKPESPQNHADLRRPTRRFLCTVGCAAIGMQIRRLGKICCGTVLRRARKIAGRKIVRLIRLWPVRVPRVVGCAYTQVGEPNSA